MEGALPLRTPSAYAKWVAVYANAFMPDVLGVFNEPGKSDVAGLLHIVGLLGPQLTVPLILEGPDLEQITHKCDRSPACFEHPIRQGTRGNRACDACEHDKDIVPPHHEPRRPTACEPRVACALNNVERGCNEDVAAKREDDGRRVERP